VAAGALYSDAAGKIAVLAKTARNAMIGFVVLGYAIYWASKGQAQTVQNKALFLWQKFPKFVLGFLLISLLATLGVFSKDQRVSHTAIVENKRLGHALALVRAQQEIKHQPKVQTNSEKGGYKKDPRRIYGPDYKPKTRKSIEVEMTV